MRGAWRFRRSFLTMSLTACVVAFAVASAWAQSGVAELEVEAYGRQRIDLATGRTILEDGGELIERGSGVRLVASWIAYAEGVDVAARDARIEGELGRVDAPRVAIDLGLGRLTASGGVVWRRAGLEVSGERLWFDAGTAVVGLLGGIEAREPDASAAEVWIDLASGRVLLVGPYRYADGPLVLRGGEDGALQLDAVETDDGIVYDANTVVDEHWLAAVAALREAWGTTSDD
jgi:hypothetical protein